MHCPSTPAGARARRSLHACLAVALAVAAVATTGASLAVASDSGPGMAAESAAIDPPLRGLWTRGPSRFIRQWIMLGPVPGSLNEDLLASAGGEASARPAASNSAGGWAPHASYHDIVDVSGALGSPPYRGTNAAPEVAYAYATVNREREGEAVLSLGSDTALRIWVNGALVHSEPASSGFSYDSASVPVRLKSGENALLVKLEHRSGPWRFALRVLEPGTIVTPRQEISPSLSNDAAGVLTVRTDTKQDLQAARVDVSVLAAGGKSVAQAAAPRGDAVQFQTQDWPDGAYEIRLTTRTAWGERVLMHLPWYKGDALAAASRLLEAAKSAPSGLDGSLTRLLADMVLDRLGGDPKQAPDDVWPLLHAPLLELEELRLEARGDGSGPVRPNGFVRLAYVDDTDGSTQFCRAYLPPAYDASARWPLVVVLHGFNPDNPPYVRWWSVDQRHNDTAELHNVIVLEPHGRGNAQYLGIGEKDVLRCLAEAKRRFSVNDDRVYLLGDSMGGSGTWIIASRHPEIFAAIAPIFGGWDYRLIPGAGYDNPRATLASERVAQELQSSFVGAEGLLNMPIFVSHGDDDHSVSVEYSRHAVRMLQRWGYDIRYEEYPGWGHENLNSRDRIVAWLLQHQRVTAPRKVRIRSMDLAGASAYWVQIMARETPLDAMRVDAEVIAPGLIRLDTSNVSALRLSPPETLRNGASALRVVWNGQERHAALSADGTTQLLAPGFRPGRLDKTPALEGRLSNLITKPFAIVVGTASADPAMRRMCREKAEEFVRRWSAWQHQTPRVFTDRELSRQDEQRYSLLLIGGPEANRVTRRLAARLPLRVQSDAITIDGRKFAVRDAVVQMIYPNPSQPEQYVLVVAATSAAGLYFWNPAYWQVPFGFPTLFADWTIRDGRRVVLEPGLGPERGWVASGVFDSHWRLDDRWVFPGDAKLRAQSPLRRPAPPGFAVPEAVLDTYTGSYEMAPGFAVSIARTGQTLIAAMPNGDKVPLTAESETEFATGGASVVFERDEAGNVTGMTFNEEGQQLTGKKLSATTQ